MEGLKDELFVLLGVNSDRDQDELRKIIEEEPITWRSWWDGGPRGPIATRWNVRGWPSVYVLDHKGVIRCAAHMRLSEQEINYVVDLLLREVD